MAQPTATRMVGSATSVLAILCRSVVERNHTGKTSVTQLTNVTQLELISAITHLMSLKLLAWLSNVFSYASQGHIK